MSLVGMGFDSKCDFVPPTIFLGLLLCLWTWGIFFGGIQHSPVDDVILEFSQEKMSTCPSTLPSCKLIIVYRFPPQSVSPIRKLP